MKAEGGCPSANTKGFREDNKHINACTLCKKWQVYKNDMLPLKQTLEKHKPVFFRGSIYVKESEVHSRGVGTSCRTIRAR